MEHRGRYSLPLITNELLTFDLRTGAVLARAPFPEETLAGNLVAAEGRLISQSATGIRTYAGVEQPAAWLAAIEAATPAAPRDLAAAGELLLHAGESDRGLAHLRAAIAADNDLRARLVVAATLTERLRLDFAAHRADAEEVERLVAGTTDEANFRRLMATQSEAVGDRQEAFRQLLGLSVLVGDEPSLEMIDRQWSVSLDRWVVGRLRGLLAAAEASERDVLIELLRVELRRFQESSAPVAPAAAKRLLLVARGTALEAELSLGLARTSGTAPPVEALAALARGRTARRSGGTGRSGRATGGTLPHYRLRSAGGSVHRETPDRVRSRTGPRWPDRQ